MASVAGSNGLTGGRAHFWSVSNGAKYVSHARPENTINLSYFLRESI
jgi:hypothetical protein